MVERLWRWSGEGALPIVIDAASCTQGVADPGEEVLEEDNAERLAELEILDSVAWAHDRLLPWLEVRRKVGSATVHPTCATRLMGLAPRLRSLAGALAEDVYVAPSATCCGFAGDRGISHPELTAAATRDQAGELAGREFDARLSSNRTCEIGLSRATGERYESFLFLLEELTRPALIVIEAARAPRGGGPSRLRPGFALVLVFAYWVGPTERLDRSVLDALSTSTGSFANHVAYVGFQVVNFRPTWVAWGRSPS